jgi:DNA-binding SARP family transcriptional activator/TolB-like protein
MYLLETLGSIRLSDDEGREIDRLLQQTKRLALLAYLASPRPGTWHRRDVLVSIFSPELDSARARTALRNALHVLRQHMKEGIVRTRGDDEVSIDPALFDSDVARMEREVAQGRFAEAFERYRGEFLRGIYIKDAETFERWVDDERRRLLAVARAAGTALADERERAGDRAASIATMERLVELEPHDESHTRRLIGLLDRAGDKARALAAYERFRARLAEDFGAEPSSKTVAQVEFIRAMRPRVLPSDDHVGALANRRDRVGVDTHDTNDQDVAPAVRPRDRTRRLRWAGTSAVVLALAAIAIASSTLRSHDTVAVRKLTILRENATDDSLSYVAFGISEDVARRLRGMGGMRVVSSGGMLPFTPKVQNDLALVGRQFGTDVAVRSRLIRNGDSLAVSADIIDLASRRARSLGTFTFSSGNMRDAASQMAAAIAGALFRARVPLLPRVTDDQLNSESYRLTIAGWDNLLNRNRPDLAKTQFMAAVEKDPTNARAYAGLTSLWAGATVTGKVPFAAGAERAEMYGERALALDSLDGTPWANLGFLRALENRHLAEGESLFAKAIALDPSNPELYMVQSAMYRHAWQWDKARDAARMGRRLDPFSPRYVAQEALVALCTDRPDEALTLARSKLSVDSMDASARDMAARALARLGRWDEAIAQLRLTERNANGSLQAPGSRTAPTSADTLHGEAGYWAILERRGREALTRLEAEAREGWVDPVRMAGLEIAAGELDQGMDRLERQVRAGQPVYNLPCNASFDHVRNTARFQKLLASPPKWEP